MKKIAAKNAPNPYKSSRTILDNMPVVSTNSSFLQSNPNYFQSFTYMDHITNNKLNLLTKQEKSPDCNCTASVGDGSTDCFGLMMETKKFHINSIKNKNYRIRQEKGAEGNGDDFQVKHKRNYIIRRKNEKEKYNQDKRQLNLLLSRNSNYLSLSANVSPQESSRESSRLLLSNSALGKNPATEQEDKKGPDFDTLIQQFQKSLAKEKEARRMKIIPNIFRSEDKQLTKSEKQLVQRLNNELRREITKNSQYLVVPDLRKLKIEEKENKTPDQSLTQLPQDQPSIEIGSMKFKTQEFDYIVHRHVSPQPIPPKQTLSPEQKAFFDSISQGKYFKAEIELSLNSSLLHMREPGTNNNILHLCILNNQAQIFKMIVQRCRENNINLFKVPNKYKKTPLQMAKLYRKFYDQCRGMPQFQYYY